MRVLGLVPARGGSKGVIRKNLRMLAGRPLLQHTADGARAAKSLTRIILSTDDGEIAAVGRSCGLDVPFLRPSNLAADETPMIAVVQHAIEALSAGDDTYDAVFVLQPTSPLRQSADIDGAVQLLTETGADSVISFVPVGEHQPARMKFVGDDGRVIDPEFGETVEGMRRQDLPELYLREGSVYLTRVSVLMESSSFKGRDCRAWIIPPERACNIDTEFDLFLAECLLQRAARAG